MNVRVEPNKAKGKSSDRPKPKAKPVKLTARSGRRLGLDENGLGPRLGPLIVTAALARVEEPGVARFYRKLPKAIRSDLDDSKALVSCHDYSIAEAWARVLVRRNGGAAACPEDLLRDLAGSSIEQIQRTCPKSTRKQCWGAEHETFVSSDEQCERVEKHLERFAEMGIIIEKVESEVICAGKLNALKDEGVHRFSADLHAMERLILSLHGQTGQMIEAVCGKVGGIGKYESFFGPLSGRLRTALEEGQAKSSYYFPQLGTIHFVRDADASDPLVMLASVVGKYLRERLMGRIAHFYREQVEEECRTPSGYHDPVTARFVEQTHAYRKKLNIVQPCFERRPASEG